MKKILKNKKGFTLIELLAVIVVLAIIMVIATQQIGNVIKKNTVNSFKSSLDMVVKQAKSAEVMASGALTIEDIKELVDYDTQQFDITFNDDATNQICIESVTGGKFDKMDKDTINTIFSSSNYIKKTLPNSDAKPATTTTTICKKFR